jgi:hypothetical protein
MSFAASISSTSKTKSSHLLHSLWKRPRTTSSSSNHSKRKRGSHAHADGGYPRTSSSKVIISISCITSSSSSFVQSAKEFTRSSRVKSNQVPVTKMSTDLLLAPKLTYKDVLSSLPKGILIHTCFEPGNDSTFRMTVDKACFAKSRLNPDVMQPLHSPPTRHVLLMDKCGNTLWMYQANEYAIKRKRARDVGEAAFEHFGMQGSILHFAQSFSDRGQTFFEAIFIQSLREIGYEDENRLDDDLDFGIWSQCGLVRKSDNVTLRTCSRCYPAHNKQTQ